MIYTGIFLYLCVHLCTHLGIHWYIGTAWRSTEWFWSSNQETVFMKACRRRWDVLERGKSLCWPDYSCQQSPAVQQERWLHWRAAKGTAGLPVGRWVWNTDLNCCFLPLNRKQHQIWHQRQMTLMVVQSRLMWAILFTPQGELSPHPLSTEKGHCYSVRAGWEAGAAWCACEGMCWGEGPACNDGKLHGGTGETNSGRGAKVAAASVTSGDELTGQCRPQPHGENDQVQ